MKRWCIIVSVLVLSASCTKPPIPKEYGYFRIDLPEHSYTYYQGNQDGVPALPYNFLLSDYAQVRTHDGGRYWIDILYPQWNVNVHCSYRAIQGNLKELSDDAMEFVYKHTIKASAIPERAYSNPEADVYGLTFDFAGNTATTMQFVLTDSVQHFFRGAVYFSNVPNEDSIAPVAAFIREDMVNLIESFRWKR
jgi:gliding motility-associated lipoprotein GldD